MIAVVSSQWSWAQIVGALVPSVIALVAAIIGVLNRKALKTGTGDTLGHIVSDTSAQLVTGNDKTAGEMITELHGEASAQSTPYETHAP